MKVGFVLLSGSRNPIPSTRVAVLNMLSFLEEAGIQTEIVFDPEIACEEPVLPSDLEDHICSAGCDVVVFQKVRGKSVGELADRLESRGVRCIYMVCDIVDEAMARRTTGTIVVTEFLRSLYPHELAQRIHVVHDGIERPQTFKSTARPVVATVENPLRAVLVTSAALESVPVLSHLPDWLELTIVAAYPSRSRRLDRFNWARWAFASKRLIRDRIELLKFLSHPRIRLEAWDPQGVYNHLLDADVGIIPIDTTHPFEADATTPPSWSVKSENRLTLKMSAALPVVATPIPSYVPVVEHGRNGFLANDLTDWFDALELLRDPSTREAIGHAARESVRERYSMQTQARLLIDALQYTVLQPGGGSASLRCDRTDT